MVTLSVILTNTGTKLVPSLTIEVRNLSDILRNTTPKSTNIDHACIPVYINYYQATRAVVVVSRELWSLNRGRDHAESCVMLPAGQSRSRVECRADCHLVVGQGRQKRSERARASTHASLGTWCSGIEPTSHAESPWFKSQCIHCQAM